MKELIKQIRDTKRKLALTIARGLIHSVGDDLNAQASFLSDEPKQKTDIVQHYGFTSRPLKGCECVAICPGNRENLVIIATKDKRHQLDLANGEVALFTAEGDHIHLKTGNIIEIKTSKIRIENNKNELISVIHDLAEALEQATTATLIGTGRHRL